MRVGVIGLGALGRPISELLLKARYRTAVYDVRREPVQLLPHVQPVGEDRDLLRQALRIYRDAACQPLHVLSQPHPLRPRPARQARRMPVP